MNLLLIRKYRDKASTGGELFIDGKFECYTLEDPIRKHGTKIVGNTAIPYGTYILTIDFSNRFQKNMPHILDVPEFTGIRIHSGNTAADTEGCILVGQTRGENYVGQSKMAFEGLMRKLTGEKRITITIRES